MFGFTNPGPYFGPANMLHCYQNVECSVPGGTATVSVKKYRNRNNPLEKGGTQHAEKIKNALIWAGTDVLKRGGGNKTFVEVCYGKGSPWEIGTVLGLLVDSADSFIKKFGSAAKGTPERKCADLLADDNLSWEAALQKVCDDWIGLDCNGFVGNWLEIVEPSFKLNQDHKSFDVLPKAKTTRKDMKEFDYWDIMCYAQNEHIPVINQKGSASDRFEICQSAGDGPSKKEYAIYPTSKDPKGRQMFRLAARSKQDVGTDFYVVSLW